MLKIANFAILIGKVYKGNPFVGTFNTLFRNFKLKHRNRNWGLQAPISFLKLRRRAHKGATFVDLNHSL